MNSARTMNRSVSGVHSFVQEVTGYYPPTSPLAAVVAETADFASLFAEGVTDEGALDDAETLLGLVIAMSGVPRKPLGFVLGVVSGYVANCMRDETGSAKTWAAA